MHSAANQSGLRSSTHDGVEEGGWREKKSEALRKSCDIRARTAVGVMLLWPSRSSTSLAAISEQTGGLYSISQGGDLQPVAESADAAALRQRDARTEGEARQPRGLQ